MAAPPACTAVTASLLAAATLLLLLSCPAEGLEALHLRELSAAAAQAGPGLR